MLGKPSKPQIRRWLGRSGPTMVVALSVVAACGGGDDDAASPKYAEAGESGGGHGGSAGAGGGTAKGGKSSGSGAGAADTTDEAGAGGVTGASGGEAGAKSEAGAGTTDTVKFPLTLTPIGTPSAATAHVALYFSTLDANGDPVAGLSTPDFVADEDGAAIDRFESAFQVTKPAGALVIPTVLLLDLSRSVVEAGALDELKKAANQIIDDLDTAQRLAIVTFAQSVTLRQSFTTDKSVLHDTVDAITQADGVSTNLYGALVTAYSLWDDGFRPYDSGAADPQLVAGLMIPISDGADTAGLATLDDAIRARGTKRTIFIRVGQEKSATAPAAIANAGVITAAGGFEDLTTAVKSATARIADLDAAIYAAEYCSPKRAGSHELVFTVKGNESYVSKSKPAQPGSGATGGTGATGGSGGAATLGGPAITVDFSATEFKDSQCDDLFNSMTGEAGRGGTSGSGGAMGVGGATGGSSGATGRAGATGGSGRSGGFGGSNAGTSGKGGAGGSFGGSSSGGLGGGGFGKAGGGAGGRFGGAGLGGRSSGGAGGSSSAGSSGIWTSACEAYAEKAATVCGGMVSSATVDGVGPFAIGSSCQAPPSGCELQFEYLLSCGLAYVTSSECGGVHGSMTEEIVEMGHCASEASDYSTCASSP
jgi:hypothetical protein